MPPNDLFFKKDKNIKTTPKDHKKIIAALYPNHESNVAERKIVVNYTFVIAPTTIASLWAYPGGNQFLTCFIRNYSPYNTE